MSISHIVARVDALPDNFEVPAGDGVLFAQGHTQSVLKLNMCLVHLEKQHNRQTVETHARAFTLHVLRICSCGSSQLPAWWFHILMLCARCERNRTLHSHSRRTGRHSASRQPLRRCKWTGRALLCLQPSAGPDTG